MLLSFSFANNRAFAHFSALNLTASRLKEVEDGRVVDVGNPDHTRALTSAVILGRNGSGKSTFVEAMRTVSSLVRNSSKESNADDELVHTPNLLVEGKSAEPTSYNVVFSMKETVFDFSFSHDKKRILHERLDVADRSSRFRKMYERDYVGESYHYSFGEALIGRRSVWQDSTRMNALFLSTAVQLNATALEPAFLWLSKYLRPIELSNNTLVTGDMCKGDPVRRRQIVSFLRALDIGLVDIEVEDEPIDRKAIESLFNAEFIESLAKLGDDGIDFSKRQTVRFLRKRDDGELIRFNLTEESTGTQALFSLAGPLLDTLKHGFCLVVDEINTSLHPLVLRFLIDLFSDARLNKKRAQLVFTTHDTSILSNTRMRRDQVWFIESVDGSATLSPLTSFSPRKSEAVDRGYLGGRYGGVPIVSPSLVEALMDNGSEG